MIAVDPILVLAHKSEWCLSWRLELLDVAVPVWVRWLRDWTARGLLEAGGFRVIWREATDNVLCPCSER